MSDSWSELFAARRAVARRFGRIRSLPEVRRPRAVLGQVARAGLHVLDVGAGDRRNERHLRALAEDLHYESLDVDPAGEHDYREFSELSRTYDLVVSFEVIEHLHRDEIPEWMDHLRAAVAPGGHVLLSTPNTWHPQEFLRDMTHKTPVPYDQLGGLLEMRGLEVEGIWRVHPGGWVGRIARRYLFRWLFALQRSDYARQVVVLARAPNEG